MPQKERLRVWRGELKKTSGGLKKSQLIKNKRGKIVSRRKSGQSKKTETNNLKNWLRSKGDKFGDKPKGLKDEEDGPEEEKMSEVPAKPKTKPKKAAPKPKKGPPPKITKVAPMKAGEKKELHKISVGNIHVPKNNAAEKYVRNAKYYKDKKGWTRAQIIKRLGPVPAGAKF